MSDLMMPHLMALLIFFVFCVAVIYGAVCDVTNFTIPNGVSLVLVGDFAVYAVLGWNETPILFQLALAVLTFVICFIFWRFGQIGGGDVKFISVLALWMHPQTIGIFFLLLALASLLFIAALRWARQWNTYIQHSEVPAFVKKLIDKTEQQVIPYGVPAAISALAVRFLI